MLFEHIDLKPRNPYLGLALDEAFCLYLSRNNGTMSNSSSMPFQGGFRLWTSPYSAILGRSCKVDETIRFPLEASFSRNIFVTNEAGERVPLCRRLSGGGTVLHGAGILNYSIFLSLKSYPKIFSLKYSYNILLSIVKEALQAQNIACKIAGLSDIVLIEKNGTLRKVSGNAQFRRKGILVFHGSLVIRKEMINMIEDYLSHPPQEPNYRSSRKHTDFLGYLGLSFDFAAFYKFFSKKIGELNNKTEPVTSLSPEQKSLVYNIARRIAIDNYMRPEWILDARTNYESASFKEKIHGKKRIHS